MPELNFNLYNFSGDMLAFLREEELTPEQQENILGVLGLSTEGLEGPQGEQGFHGFKYDIRRTNANNNNGYVVGEIVEYQGSYYICLLNNDAIIPTSTTYWAPYSFVGPQGPQGQSSSELLKPYLYNKYLHEEIVPNYWDSTGPTSLSGPYSTGYEITRFPDGVTNLEIDGGFIEALTKDSYGYDPLPFSIYFITTSTADPADRVTIDAIIRTIGNCSTIENYPSGFTRYLNLTEASFDNGGCFFDGEEQQIIEIMLNTDWVINWPFDGIVVDPYIPIATWPDITTVVESELYSRYSQSEGVLYYSNLLPNTLEEMTIVTGIGFFPYRNFINGLYFTSYNLQMSSDPFDVEKQYYYYQFV